MPFTIESRLQVAAVTLAEELNFTRAADRLGISQPALSKQIVELETSVGISLFSRDHRKVEVTDAGEIFIQGCRDAFALVERAVRLARTNKDVTIPVLGIGHSPYADPELIALLLSTHLPLYPELRLRLESMFALDLAHGVLSAELDLALIAEPAVNPLLTLVPLATDPLCVAMPTDHPSAKKKRVQLNDFGNVGWMVFTRKSHPVIYDRVQEAARQEAVAPIELHHYVGPHEAVQLIGERFGIAIMPKGIALQLDPRLVAVRPLIEGNLQVTSYLVLRADEGSRLVNQFGRAFLKKALPDSRLAGATGQLLLDF